MRYRSSRDGNLNPIWAIIIINLVVYIATMIYPKLILLLGLQPIYFFDRPWTIVTNMFAHAGLWHVLGNMVTLYFFGSFLVKLIGVKKFLLVYFGGGILGNLFYILLGSPFSIAIGASGAVFALGGALTAITPKLKVYIFPIPAPIPLWIAIIGGFLILSLIPSIAWQAHLGGLLLGLITGYFFRKKLRVIFY